MGCFLTSFRSREHWASRAAWILLLILFAILFYRHLANFDFQHGEIPQDFGVEVKAAKLIRAGQIPYDPADYLTYKYSPGSLALWLSMPTQPIQAWIFAKLVFLVMWVLSLALGARVRSWRDLGLLLIGIVLSWKGLIETLDYGQYEFILLFIASMGAVLFPGFPMLAGFIAGTAPWIKLPWGLMIVPFLIYGLRSGHRHGFRLGIGVALSSLAWGLLIPIALFGLTKTIELTHAWIHVLRTQPSYLFFREQSNQSLWATSLRWFGTDHSKVALLVAGVIATGFFLPLVRKTLTARMNERPIAWITPWILMTLLLNPLSWRWASMLTVGAAFAQQEGVEGRFRLRTKLIWVLIGVFFLLQQNPVVHLLGFGHWIQLHPYGLITFYWMSLLALAF